MRSKGQGNVMMIILITIILAMVAISVVWGVIRSQRDTTAIIGDPFTGANETCVRLTDDCFVAGTLSINNATDAAKDLTGNFTECGSASVLYGALGNIVACPECEGTLNASYTEHECSRITGLTGTIIDYVPLIMAVVILVFVAGFAIK